ncbi:MAG: hypothetical protein ACLKAK_13215 [Alkaliphilus sp.]
MKRIISFVLTMIMICNLTASVHAQPIGNKHINVRTIEQSINEQGDIIKEVSIIGEALYYFEANDEYVLSIGVSKQGFVDIAINYKKRGVVLSKRLDLKKHIAGFSEGIRINRNRKFDKQAIDIASKIKALVLSERIELNKMKGLVDEEKVTTQMVSSNDRNEIMAEVYDLNFLRPFHDRVVDALTQDGVHAKLSHSISYNIVRRSQVTAIVV